LQVELAVGSALPAPVPIVTAAAPTTAEALSASTSFRMANLPVVIEDIPAALHWPIADLSLGYRWAYRWGPVETFQNASR
jgi:hypothetical protein